MKPASAFKFCTNGVALVTAVLACLIASDGSGPPRALAQTSGLIFGICGHPSTSSTNTLWNNPATQVATVSQRGLKTYRFDVPLTNDHPEWAGPNGFLQQMLTIAGQYNITLHPVLYVPFTWGTLPPSSTPGSPTLQDFENEGYNRVYNFIASNPNFAAQIHDWEMENELNFLHNIKSGTGMSSTDYQTTLASQWAATLKGMTHAIQVIKANTGQPLRSVVNFGYLDFGFIPFLQGQGVTIDKGAYHYYYGLHTDPTKIYPPLSWGMSGTVDIFQQMSKIGLPFIINELNAGEISSSTPTTYNDGTALLSLKTHIQNIQKQTEANIEGIEFYELYNEPSKPYPESNFGFMADPVTIKTQILVAAAYSCGQLSDGEKNTLISSGLFTATELSNLQASCH